jgi:hypothetical protein
VQLDCVSKAEAKAKLSSEQPAQKLVLQVKHVRRLTHGQPVNAIGKRLPHLRIVRQRRCEHGFTDPTHALDAHRLSLSGNCNARVSAKHFLFQPVEIRRFCPGAIPRGNV